MNTTDTRTPGIALLFAQGDEPAVGHTTWNQITKAGRYEGHRQGVFSFDATTTAQLLANFAANGDGRVPVDYEHTSEALPENAAQEGVPAVAWIVAVEDRDGDVWGCFEWVSPRAVEYVRAGQYRDLRKIDEDAPRRWAEAVRAALLVDPNRRAASPDALAELWFGGSSERPKKLARNAPVGRVTLVFTDIQGSTRLWEVRPELARNALRAHDAVMRSTLHRHGGYEVKTEGDAFMVAFPTCQNAVRFCLDAQRTLHSHPWSPELLALPEAAEAPGFRGVRVRMGIHVGEPEVRADGDHVDYFGPMVNRSARISQAGHGGQILASGEVWDAVGRSVDGAKGTLLGRFQLKGLDGAQTIVQLVPEELVDRTFPAVRAAPV